MPNTPLVDLSARAKSGEPLFIGWCGSFDPFVPEAMLTAGFETVLLDMQHGTLDFATAARGVAHMAARGRPAFVRIPVGEFATASKLLDVGAAAIVPTRGTVTARSAIAPSSTFSVSSGARLNSSMYRKPPDRMASRSGPSTKLSAL